MRAFAFAWASLVLAASAVGQSGLFGSEEEAFILMPAQAIASGTVVNVSISASGRLIVYQQNAIGTAQGLLDPQNPVASNWFVYDRMSKATRQLKVPYTVGEIVPMGDDQHAYFLTGDTQSGFINLQTGQLIALQAEHIPINYFGNLAVAPFLIGVTKQNTVEFFFPDGSRGSAKVDTTKHIRFIIGGDANSLIFYGDDRGTPARAIKATLNRKTLMFTYSEFGNNEVGTIQDLQYPAQKFMVRESGDMNYLSLRNASAILTAAAQNPNSIQQRSKPRNSEPNLLPKSVRLGPYGGPVAFSSKGDFVVYLDAGALLLREISPVKMDAAQKLALEDLKKMLLNRAKQVGTGFMIYAADNDDVLPGQEGWESKLVPYFKNKGIYQDFNYSFKGGDINNVSNPSGTEMGFIMGPGGRAVVYLDGSAKWVANP